MLDDLEELEDIKRYDAAKKSELSQGNWINYWISPLIFNLRRFYPYLEFKLHADRF